MACVSPTEYVWTVECGQTLTVMCLFTDLVDPRFSAGQSSDKIIDQLKSNIEKLNSEPCPLLEISGLYTFNIGNRDFGLSTKMLKYGEKKERIFFDHGVTIV